MNLGGKHNSDHNVIQTGILQMRERDLSWISEQTGVRGHAAPAPPPHVLQAAHGFPQPYNLNSIPNKAPTCSFVKGERLMDLIQWPALALASGK